MSCLPSMPKRAWRIWTTPCATSCAEKELPRCSRRSRPQLPQHVLHHCPLALWAKPRTTRWRFGPNSRSSWNTRNSNSATISPKTPCAPLRSVAKTGSTSAANKPDPKSPPSSPSSKPADVGTSPCANTWRRSSPVSPKLPSITYPNSPPSPGPHKTADLHPLVNHGLLRRVRFNDSTERPECNADGHGQRTSYGSKRSCVAASGSGCSEPRYQCREVHGDQRLGILSTRRASPRTVFGIRQSEWLSQCPRVGAGASGQHHFTGFRTPSWNARRRRNGEWDEPDTAANRSFYQYLT